MSISKTPGGRWRAFVKWGRSTVATRTFDLKRDAQAWHDAQRRALELGTFVDPTLGREALGSAIDRWMLAREGTVAGSTIKSDRNRLKYLPSRLANTPVSKVRTADVRVLLEGMVRRGLSPASATRVRAMLSSFYGWAVGEGIASSNPVLDAKVPPGVSTNEKDEVYPFSVDELRALVVELSRRSPEQAQVALVLGLTGLRWGELCALRVRDVSVMPRAAFHVSRSAPDGQEVRNRTKGGRSRSVPLPDELVPIIDAWSIGKNPDDLLFSSPEGHRLNNSNWRRIVGWPEACAGRRVQDLRHTAATFWLQSGIDVKTVQQWLGHANAQLTLNTYSHWMGGTADAAAIARVNETLSQGHAGGTRLRS